MRRSSAIIMGLFLTSTTSLISVNAVADLKLVGGGNSEIGFIKPVSNWKTKEVLTKSGKVGYCAMVNHYEKGVMLAVAKNQKGSGSFALDFQNPMFDAGREYLVVLGVDNGFSKKLMGKANSANSLIIQYGQDSELYNAIQTGKRLDVVLPDNGISFDLIGYNNGLNNLNNCLTGGNKKIKEAKVITPEVKLEKEPKEVTVRRQKRVNWDEKPSVQMMDMDNSVIRSTPADSGVITNVVELGKKVVEPVAKSAPVLAKSAPVIITNPDLSAPVRVMEKAVPRQYGSANTEILSENKITQSIPNVEKEMVTSNATSMAEKEIPYVRNKNGFVTSDNIDKPSVAKQEFSWEDRANSIRDTRTLLDGLNISRLSNKNDMPKNTTETVSVKAPDLNSEIDTATNNSNIITEPVINTPQPVKTKIYDNRQEFSISDNSITNNIPELANNYQSMDKGEDLKESEVLKNPISNQQVVSETPEYNGQLSKSLVTNVPIAAMEREISQRQTDLSRQSQANVEQAEWLEIEKSKIEKMKNSVSEDYSGPSYFSGSKVLKKPSSDSMLELPNPDNITSSIEPKIIEENKNNLTVNDIEWNNSDSIIAEEINIETSEDIISSPVVIDVPNNDLENKVQQMKLSLEKEIISEEFYVPSEPTVIKPIKNAPVISRAPSEEVGDKSLKLSSGIYQAWRGGNVSKRSTKEVEFVEPSTPVPAMIEPIRPKISDFIASEETDMVKNNNETLESNINKVQEPNVFVDTTMVFPNNKVEENYKLDDMQDDSFVKNGQLIIEEDVTIINEPVQIYNIPEENVVITTEDRFVGQINEVSNPETVFIEEEFATISEPMNVIPQKTVEIRRGRGLNEAIPTPGRVISRFDNYLNKGKQIVLPVSDDINQANGYFKPLPHEKAKLEEPMFDEYIPKKEVSVNDAELDDTMNFLDGVMKHHKLKRSAK